MCLLMLSVGSATEEWVVGLHAPDCAEDVSQHRAMWWDVMPFHAGRFAMFCPIPIRTGIAVLTLA